MPNTHSITVGLYIRAGSKYESFEENGITHFLEHLHFRRLGDLSQQDLYYNMESIGGTLRAQTGRDYLKFSMKILPKHLFACLQIFKRIVTADNWTESDLKLEKSVVINQIDQHYYTNESLAHDLIFKNSSLSYEIMGSVENVESFGLKKIKSFKRRIFNNENMLLCVTGNIDESSKNLIKSTFEDLNINCGMKLYNNCIPGHYFKRKPDIVFDYADWDMLDVHLAFDVSSSVSEEKINLLNCITGEGVGSRLQGVLREKLGYTADISSYTEVYEECSVIHIVYTVNKKHFTDSLKALTDTLNKMKHNICEKDICVSLPFYSDNLAFVLDDTEQMNHIIGYYRFVINKEFNSIKCGDVTELCETLMTYAKNIFTPKNTCIAVTGNCRGITKKTVSNILNNLDNERFK